MLVSIANAKQGMALDGDLFSDNNEKILASGTVLTDAIISLIKSEGIDSINLSISEDEQKKWGLNENYVNPTVNKKTTDSARNLLTKLITPEGYQNLNNESIQSITHIAELISAKILAANNTLSYDINDYVKNKDLISQSIRVSTYATALAKQYNNTLASSNMTSKINLEEIATAGLLANYGTICADEDVRHKLDYYIPLKDDFPGLAEEKIIELKINYDPEYVSYYSYNLLRECEQLSSFIKNAITLSSENDKKTGPLQAIQFSGELTNKSATVIAAKILSLSKKFDEILSKNINKDGDLSPVETALKELFASEEYSKDLIDLFMNAIPLYPVGTKVELKGVHNGIGVVVDNHNDINTWHRPTVKCLETDEEVDLRIENTTQISNLLGHDIEVSDKKENVEEAVVIPTVEAPMEPTEESEVKEESVPISVPEEPKVEEPTQEVEEPVIPEVPAAEPTVVAPEVTPTVETPVEPTETAEVKEEEPVPVTVPEEPKAEEPTQEAEEPVIPEVSAAEPSIVVPEVTEEPATPAEPTETAEVKEDEPVPVSVPEEPKAEEPTPEVVEPVTVAEPSVVVPEVTPTVETPAEVTETTEAKEDEPVPVSVPEEPKAEEPVTVTEPVAEPSVASPEATQAAETPAEVTATAEVKEETPAPVSVAEEPKVEEPVTVTEPVAEPSVVTPEVTPTVEAPVAPTPTETVNTNTQTTIEPSSEPTKVIEDIIPSEPIDPIGQNNQAVTEPTPVVENTTSAAEQPIELVSGPANIFGNNNYVPEEQITLNSGPAGVFGYSNYQQEEPEQSVGMRR